MVAAVAILRKVRIPDTTWSFVVPHIIAPNRLSGLGEVQTSRTMPGFLCE